jgi:uncharacterized membrane protein
MANVNYLSVLALWVHIASAAVLLGGVIYARYVVAPALAGLNDAERHNASERMAAGFRMWIIGAIFGLLASGMYNFIMRLESASSDFLLLFAIKMLLALHVFAVGMILGKPGVDAAKRTRLMTGVVFSGMAVLVISSFLRWV